MERRTFLTLCAAAVGLAGCTSGDPDPAPTAPSDWDPDAALRQRVAESELLLISAYREAIEAHPELEEELATLAAHHEAHLEQVAVGRPGAAPGSSDGSAPPWVSPGTPSPRGSARRPRRSGTPEPSPPPSLDATLRRLADEERDAHRARVSACDGAQSTELARSLCLIAASEAQHSAVLVSLAARVDTQEVQ